MAIGGSNTRAEEALFRFATGGGVAEGCAAHPASNPTEMTIHPILITGLTQTKCQHHTYGNAGYRAAMAILTLPDVSQKQHEALRFNHKLAFSCP
jgi:hypothetical protein